MALLRNICKAIWAGFATFAVLGLYITWQNYGEAGVGGFKAYAVLSAVWILYSGFLGAVGLGILALILYPIFKLIKKEIAFEVYLAIGAGLVYLLYNSVVTLIDVFFRKAPTTNLSVLWNVLLYAFLIFALTMATLKLVKKVLSLAKYFGVVFSALFIIVWFCGWLIINKAPNVDVGIKSEYKNVAEVSKNDVKNVFMIVLDGGSWDVLLPLIRENKLPNIKYLMLI